MFSLGGSYRDYKEPKVSIGGSLRDKKCFMRNINPSYHLQTSFPSFPSLHNTPCIIIIFFPFQEKNTEKQFFSFEKENQK